MRQYSVFLYKHVIIISTPLLNAPYSAQPLQGRCVKQQGQDSGQNRSVTAVCKATISQWFIHNDNLTANKT